MVAALELSIELRLKLVFLDDSVNHVSLSILIKKIGQFIEYENVFRLILILPGSHCLEIESHNVSVEIEHLTDIGSPAASILKLIVEGRNRDCGKLGKRIQNLLPLFLLP